MTEILYFDPARDMPPTRESQTMPHPPSLAAGVTCVALSLLAGCSPQIYQAQIGDFSSGS